MEVELLREIENTLNAIQVNTTTGVFLLLLILWYMPEDKDKK
jgi:hypothetical protein